MILLSIDFGFFRRRQGSAVLGSHRASLVVQSSFLAFHTRCFARGQGTVLNAFADAFLLVFLALTNFSFGVRVLPLGVMLLAINAVRHLILVMLDASALGCGEVAVLFHVSLFAIDDGFLVFQSRGFAGGQRTIFD